MHRLLVEIGLGIDLLGRDVNLSIVRAINDIVHRVCIPYFKEKSIDFGKSKIVVDVYTPYPEKVDESEILSALPVKTAETVVRAHRGGASVEGLEEIIVSVVAITIYVPD